MEIKRLDWDSRFLGLEVYGITCSSADRTLDAHELIRSLKNAGAGLAYIFLEQAEPALQALLTKNGAIMVDDKVTYGKKLPGSLPETFDDKQSYANDFSREIQVYTGELSEELLGLAFLAGHDSRFRKDPRLSAHFEPLYTLWMQNSLNGRIADRVFVYREAGFIKGMVSCKITDDKAGQGADGSGDRQGGRVGSIGLIATGAAYQGTGIGGQLIRATDHYYRANGVGTSTVVTQKTNRQACLFYEKEGFTEYKRQFVYHLWLN